jgi:hypothetical protein
MVPADRAVTIDAARARAIETAGPKPPLPTEGLGVLDLVRHRREHLPFRIAKTAQAEIDGQDASGLVLAGMSPRWHLPEPLYRAFDNVSRKSGWSHSFARRIASRCRIVAAGEAGRAESDIQLCVGAVIGSSRLAGGNENGGMPTP